MATKAVVGSSPISFIAEDTASFVGVQFQVPLAVLQYDTVTGAVAPISTWAPPTSGTALGANDQANLTAILKDFLARGLIAPTPP